MNEEIKARTAMAVMIAFDADGANALAQLAGEHPDRTVADWFHGALDVAEDGLGANVLAIRVQHDVFSSALVSERLEGPAFPHIDDVMSAVSEFVAEINDVHQEVQKFGQAFGLDALPQEKALEASRIVQLERALDQAIKFGGFDYDVASNTPQIRNSLLSEAIDTTQAPELAEFMASRFVKNMVTG